MIDTITNFLSLNGAIPVVLGAMLLLTAIKVAKKAIKLAVTLAILAFILIILGII